MEEKTTEEKLKEAEENYKALKAQAAEEKKFRKDNRVKLNAEKDAKLEDIKAVLKDVQKELYAFNRLGKRKQLASDILGTIADMVANEDAEPRPEPEEAPEEE